MVEEHYNYSQRFLLGEALPEVGGQDRFGRTLLSITPIDESRRTQLSEIITELEKIRHDLYADGKFRYGVSGEDEYGEVMGWVPIETPDTLEVTAKIEELEEERSRLLVRKTVWDREKTPEEIEASKTWTDHLQRRDTPFLNSINQAAVNHERQVLWGIQTPTQTGDGQEIIGITVDGAKVIRGHDGTIRTEPPTDPNDPIVYKPSDPPTPEEAAIDEKVRKLR